MFINYRQGFYNPSCSVFCLFLPIVCYWNNKSCSESAKSCSALAHIIERSRKDGSIAYLAQIAIKRKGEWAHRESRSFDRKSAANAWLKKRMKEIDAAGDDLSAIRNRGRTLADAIERYTRESVKEIGLANVRSAA